MFIDSIKIEGAELKINLCLRVLSFCVSICGIEKENFLCFDRPLKMTLLY